MQGQELIPIAFVVFWILVIGLVLAWKVFGLFEIKGKFRPRGYGPKVVEVRPMGRPIESAQPINWSYGVGRFPLPGGGNEREELLRKREIFSRLIEIAKNQEDISPETRKKIVREYEEKIKEFDQKLMRIK